MRLPHDEGIRYFQAAVAARPDDSVSRGNLGTALGATGQLEEAEVHLRKAVLLDATNVPAHLSLSTCLAEKSRYAEALDELRTALRLDPGMADTRLRCIVAEWLVHLGRLDEAIGESLAILDVDPRAGDAHIHLGRAFHASGLFEDAGEEFRQALAIGSSSAAHEGLGLVLEDSDRMDDAIAALREAVRIDVGRASARKELVRALLDVGRFEDARTEARLFLESRSEGDPVRAEASALLERCELIHELEVDLPAVLDGRRLPQGRAECFALADVFRARHDDAAAARCFADAFDAGDETHEDSDARKFDAARCAARAGSISGEAGEASGDEERAGWRSLALTWLREELGALDARLTAD